MCANWLQDLESYNEWMNEEDYEVDDSGTKKKHRGCLSVDDTMGLSDPDKKKKAKKRPRSPPSPRTKRKGWVVIAMLDLFIQSRITISFLRPGNFRSPCFIIHACLHWLISRACIGCRTLYDYGKKKKNLVKTKCRVWDNRIWVLYNERCIFNSSVNISFLDSYCCKLST